MRLNTPRYQTAKSSLSGNQTFWESMIDQSDVFAYSTANQGKGGPFGAQLWLFHPERVEYVLIGTAQAPEDSNAVISKGRASAHAEAENLSPEKRKQLIEFLKEHQREGWHVVQISSAESCPSCRAKQTLLANELIDRGLIEVGNFHVVFKATYDQTKSDANFNDSPYDQAFRAIDIADILSSEEGLVGIENAFKENDEVKAQIDSGALIYNSVTLASAHEIPESADALFRSAGAHPMAVIVRADGSILNYAIDERDPANDQMNIPEKMAIIGALYQAAKKLRDEEGKFESWNLEGSVLYTNIRHIGPMSYAESLWYNLSGITIVSNYTNDLVEEIAQEVPSNDNNALFRQVCADYDSPDMPINVVFKGDPDQASVAHLLWKARMAMEVIKNKQVERVQALKESSLIVRFLDSETNASPLDIVQTSEQSSHYNGKQAFNPKPQ